jgi:hypothetical protein
MKQLKPVKKKIKIGIKTLKPIKHKITKPVKKEFLVAEYGFIHIFFDIETQHILLKYYNKTTHKYSETKNMWPISFIKSLYSAISNAESKGLVTSGKAIAPYKENNEISAR